MSVASQRSHAGAQRFSSQATRASLPPVAGSPDIEQQKWRDIAHSADRPISALMCLPMGYRVWLVVRVGNGDNG